MLNRSYLTLLEKRTRSDAGKAKQDGATGPRRQNGEVTPALQVTPGKRDPRLVSTCTHLLLFHSPIVLRDDPELVSLY